MCVRKRCLIFIFEDDTCFCTSGLLDINGWVWVLYILCVCAKGLYIAVSSIGSTPFVVFVLFCAFRPMFVRLCVCFCIIIGSICWGLLCDMYMYIHYYDDVQCVCVCVVVVF